MRRSLLDRLSFVSESGAVTERVLLVRDFGMACLRFARPLHGIVCDEGEQASSACEALF